MLVKLKRCIYEKTKSMIMAEKPTCERCGKIAIGFQSMEGGFEYVCLEHADSLLLALKPGEKKVYGVCVLERYS
jgi:hypothetical protein